MRAQVVIRRCEHVAGTTLRAVALLASALVGCGGGTPVGPVDSVREVGLVPDPPGSSGRDSGMSTVFGGHSVWVFGDTFFASPAADGYRWRSSSWSWTDDPDSSDGLDGWTHALDGDGAPIQLIPHTADEQAFNDAHNGDLCPAVESCGARRTPWPAGAVVVDPSTDQALVFYSPMQTFPTSQFAFESDGTSIALWRSPSEPAERSTVTGGAGPTLLFGPDEPSWGAGAVIDEGSLYVYACSNTGHDDGCLVARVPPDSALDRATWRFWNGGEWVADYREAEPVFDGAPYGTVAWNGYKSRYLAWYMTPLDETIRVRSALHPEGPWSDAQTVGHGEPSRDSSNWDYALVAHPELDREDGRIVTLSYYQPGTFLDGTVHLVEVTFQ